MERQSDPIRWIGPGDIAPESTVNVRRLSDDNVGRLAMVMGQIGFLPEHPIVVRPHPDPNGTFSYEVVAGQCRAAAARAASIDRVPVIVEALDDDQARLRSWHENEHREDLSPSEKAFWTRFFFDRYVAKGMKGNEALREAARELAIDPQTARKYWWLAGGTDKVNSLVDSGDLPVGPARTIVEGTRMGEGYEADSERIDARVDWYQGLGKDDRKLALEAIKSEKREASIEELQARMEKSRDEVAEKLSFHLSREHREALVEYGSQRGLTDLQQILGFVVAQALDARRRS